MKVVIYLGSRGYVHRDVSSGNVYVHESENGKFGGKLGDMEYMKKYGAEARCDTQTV